MAMLVITRWYMSHLLIAVAGWKVDDIPSSMWSMGHFLARFWSDIHMFNA